MGWFGKKKVTERQAAKFVVTRCLEGAAQDTPRALEELSGALAPGLEALPAALTHHGSMLRLGLVVLGVENQAIRNAFPEPQATRLRRLVDEIVDEASVATRSGVNAAAVLQKVDETFQSAVLASMNPGQAIGEVLCQELGLKLQTLDDFSSTKSAACGPMELMLLGAMVVSFTQGLWSQVAQNFKLEPEPAATAPPAGSPRDAKPELSRQPPAIRTSQRVDDESAELQRKSVEQQFAIWVGMTQPLAHPDLLAIIAGEVDELPNAQGRFGFDPRNPILANGPRGEVMYLERLQSPSGAKVLYHRRGQAKVTPIEGLPIDAFEVIAADGSMKSLLFFLMYSSQRSRKPPDGYQLRPWSKLSDAEKTFVRLGACGVTALVDPFPGALPQRVLEQLRQTGLNEALALSWTTRLASVVSKLG